MIIAEIIATITDTLFLTWFVSKFIKENIFEKKWTIVIPVLQFGVQIFFDRVMLGFAIIPMIFMFLFAVAYAETLSPHTYIWNILAGIIYMSVIMLGGTLTFSVFSIFLDNNFLFAYGTISSFRLIYLIVGKTIQFSLFKMILMLFKKEKKLDMTSVTMTFVLLSGTILGLSSLAKIAVTIADKVIDNYVLMLALVITIVNILLYVFIHQIQNLQKNEYELMLMKERIAFERKQSENATKIWNSIRSVRHDLKNHFSVIKTRLDEGDFEACKRYLSGIEYTVESMGSLIRSGNSIIDYMINSKLSNLENVQVLISGYVGDFSDIEDSDMVSILGNVLDNAVEAIEKVNDNKRIELYFSKIKHNRLIVCKNSIATSVLNSNTRFVSTKPEPEYHGLGHQIIATTVKKYKGILDYFEEDGMFGIQISLPEEL